MLKSDQIIGQKKPILRSVETSLLTFSLKIWNKLPQNIKKRHSALNGFRPFIFVNFMLFIVCKRFEHLPIYRDLPLYVYSPFISFFQTPYPLLTTTL